MVEKHEKFNIKLGFIGKMELITHDENQLISNLCGDSEETATGVLFARYGVQDLEQYCNEIGMNELEFLEWVKSL